MVKSVWNKETQESQQKVIKYYGKIENGYIDDKIIFERDNYECQVCNSKKQLSIDHKIPSSRGGKDTYDNVWILCEPCNKTKRALNIYGEEIDEIYHLFTKLRFYTQAFENEYKKKQKAKGKKVNIKLMRKSISQRKLIKKMLNDVRILDIDKKLKHEGYM